MKEAVVAFAFGVPNTLISNRTIAAIASRKAREIGGPVYTQQDLMPLEPGIEVELTPENYPIRVPTLRIARGAAGWAKARGIDRLWLCAATPHLPRAIRDMRYAATEIHAAHQLAVCEEMARVPEQAWFCPGSTQTDTRLRRVWQLRDGILMHMPMHLYARIAS